MRFCDLGPLTLEIDGAVRVFSGTRQAAILQVLVLNANSWVSKDRLGTAGWGIDAVVTAASVENQVSRLRRVLSPANGADGAPALTNGAGGYRLTVPEGDIDSRRFEQLVDETRRWMAESDLDRTLRGVDEALALWRGTPYEDLTDDTTVAVVARLQELRGQLLERRIDALLLLGELGRALADSDLLVSEMPFRERLWAQRMTALARSGRTEEALRTYQRARTLLVEETGLEPGKELADLQAQILDRDPELHSVPSPPAHRPGPGPVQLPRRLPDLIGRSADLARLAAMTRPHSLVTVVGSGGCGKTRLAIEAAHAVAGSYPDGVWFVDLTAVSDPDLVVEVVVSTLGIGDATPGTTLSTLRSYLHGRRVLLVLDNCEHVLPAAAELVESLLGDASGPAVVATSREPLGVVGEQLFPLSPLPLGGETAPDGAVAGSSPAAELFLTRARAAAPLLSLAGVEQLRLVDEICVDLDGLPLAIELAAARARSFTLTEIAAQAAVDPSRLARIGHGSNDHRRTLHEAIDWSYRLLPPAEQAVHRRLSVLPGGFTATAARAVADSDDVDHLLAQLVHRSLLTATPPQNEGRPMSFSQLATVRAHAQNKLAEAGETTATIGRRNQWIRQLLTERPPLGVPAEGAWYDRLEEVYPSVRAALRDSVAPGGDPELLLLGTRLNFFWYHRSRVVEAYNWLEDALASRTNDGERARIRAAMMATLFVSGRVEEAHRLAEGVLDSIEKEGARHPEQTIEDLAAIAWAAWSRSAYDVVQRARDIMIPLTVQSQDATLELATRSVDCIARLVDPDVAANLAAASRLYDDAIAAGNVLATWAATAVINGTAVYDNRPDLSRPWTADLIRGHLALGSGGSGVFLESLANYSSLIDDDPIETLRLYAASFTQTRRVGMTWPFQPISDDLLSKLRKRLDEDTFQRAWREGQTMNLEDVAQLHPRH